MRSEFSCGLERDCSGLESRDLFVHEGVLSEIASDSNIPIGDKVGAIAFLLEHQRNYVYVDDARQAASFINRADLDEVLLRRIQDAYTRVAMDDVTFGG